MATLYRSYTETRGRLSTLLLSTLLALSCASGGERTEDGAEPASKEAKEASAKGQGGADKAAPEATSKPLPSTAQVKKELKSITNKRDQSKGDSAPSTPASQASKTKAKPKATAKTPSQAKPAAEAKSAEATEPPKTEAHAAKRTAAAGAPKVERFVNTEVLNVRTHPNRSAGVVGKLTRGSMLPVQIDGEWAKIGENQYVMVKYLSTTRPTQRRVAYGH